MCSEKAIGGVFHWTSLRRAKHCFLLLRRKKNWNLGTSRPEKQMGGGREETIPETGLAELWTQGFQQGLSPWFQLFSSFQPSFLLAASPEFIPPRLLCGFLPLLPRAFCSFVFILSVPTLLPPTASSDRNPTHAFPFYFNGLFCLLSLSF